MVYELPSCPLQTVLSIRHDTIIYALPLDSVCIQIRGKHFYSNLTEVGSKTQRQIKPIKVIKDLFDFLGMYILDKEA